MRGHKVLAVRAPVQSQDVCSATALLKGLRNLCDEEYVQGWWGVKLANLPTVGGPPHPHSLVSTLRGEILSWRGNSKIILLNETGNLPTGSQVTPFTYPEWPWQRGKVILLTYMWHFEKETARESHIELLDDLIMYFTKRVGQYFTKSLVSTP